MSGRELLIRDARLDERAAISDLTWAAYEQYTQIMTPTAWAGLRDAIRSALATEEPAERIVAEQHGEIVGSVMLFPAETQSYGDGGAVTSVPELRMLAVAPSAREQGVGRALAAECVRRARQAGATALGLHTSASLHAAIRLYERMGFARVPEDDFQPEGAELVMAYRLPLASSAE
ncbi:MAG TPA: GNAT family N-acetyltransferase [Roseiflexaceae bacterium]|jgi:predicted N-acetyltransferase YhbS|nr:GNAT family N-acetyltransferase [Roseiflexaceae bacterium]